MKHVPGHLVGFESMPDLEEAPFENDFQEEDYADGHQSYQREIEERAQHSCRYRDKVDLTTEDPKLKLDYILARQSESGEKHLIEALQEMQEQSAYRGKEDHKNIHKRYHHLKKSRSID